MSTEPKKKVDDAWKRQAEEEKKKLEEKLEKDPGEKPLPPATFGTFLASLELQARLALGELRDPESKEPVKPDLRMAQYLIDTIAMLQEKTEGNLEPAEAEGLQELLTSLRLGFVQAKQKAAAGPQTIVTA